MNVHAASFLKCFSFVIDGDRKYLKKSGLKPFSLTDRVKANLVIAALTYIPILNTIVGIALLATADGKQGTDGHAYFAYAVICLTGLGILLPPVHLIATLARKIFNEKHKDAPLLRIHY